MAMSKIKGLQMWCKARCDGYRDVEIRDMSSSWKSGLAFCAIIHRFRPDLIDYDSLKKEDEFENNDLAFRVADEELGIPALLEASDMVAMRVPDKLCVITYVAQYHNFFKDLPQLGGPGVSQVKSSPKKRPPDTAPPSTPAKVPNISSQPIKKVNTLGDTCTICRKKVYLLERQIEDHKLYHRTCYRQNIMAPTNEIYARPAALGIKPSVDRLTTDTLILRNNDAHVKMDVQNDTEESNFRQNKSLKSTLTDTTNVKPVITPVKNTSGILNNNVTKLKKDPTDNNVKTGNLGEDKLKVISNAETGKFANVNVMKDKTDFAQRKIGMSRPDVKENIAVENVTQKNSKPYGANSDANTKVVDNANFNSNNNNYNVKTHNSTVSNVHDNDTEIQDVLSRVKPIGNKKFDFDAIHHNNHLANVNNAPVPHKRKNLNDLIKEKANNDNVTANAVTNKNVQIVNASNENKNSRSDYGGSKSDTTGPKPSPRKVSPKRDETKPTDFKVPMRLATKEKELKTGLLKSLADVRKRNSGELDDILSANEKACSKLNNSDKNQINQVSTVENKKVVTQRVKVNLPAQNKSDIQITQNPYVNVDVQNTTHPNSNILKNSEKTDKKVNETVVNESEKKSNLTDVSKSRQSKEEFSLRMNNATVGNNKVTEIKLYDTHVFHPKPKDRKITNDTVGNKEKIDNVTAIKPPLDKRKENVQIQNNEQPEWQKEAKKRAEMRGGKYVDPEKPSASPMPSEKVNPQRPQRTYDNQKMDITPVSLKMKSSSKENLTVVGDDVKSILKNKKTLKPADEVPVTKDTVIYSTPNTPNNKEFVSRGIHKESGSAIEKLEQGKINIKVPVRKDRSNVVTQPKSFYHVLEKGENHVHESQNYDSNAKSGDKIDNKVKDVKITSRDESLSPPVRPRLPRSVKTTDTGSLDNTDKTDLPQNGTRLTRQNIVSSKALNGNLKRQTHVSPEKHARTSPPRVFPGTKPTVSPETKPTQHVSPRPLPGMKPTPRDVSPTSPGRRPKRKAPGRPPPPRRSANMNRLCVEEIQQQLSVIDDKLTELERKGRALEDAIRKASGEEDDKLMIDWFTLVNEKNLLVRDEADIIYQAREQDLEDQQIDIDNQLRMILNKPDMEKTAEDFKREEYLLTELLRVVEQRDRIVGSIDEDKQRYEEEDADIVRMMAKKGFIADAAM